MNNLDLPIRDYALIGNVQTAALVATNGSIDWCCLPDFDSPAVFCRLLDAEKGGSFRVGPTTARYRTRRFYVEPTNVFSTTFETDSGKIRLIDFMPVGGSKADSRILRLAEGLAGEVELEIGFRPTFDYARASTSLTTFDGGAIARSENEVLKLRCPVRLLANPSGGLTGQIPITQGQRIWFELSYDLGAGTEEFGHAPADLDEALTRTIEYWRKWSGGCTYHGPYANLVRRSALALKLMTFAPTGALVAAPTASLPECVGGSRNWDYRFTWLRDSSLIIYALQLIGYDNEASDFLEWLNRLEISTHGIRIMYSIRGESVLPEATLDHLSGYRNSRPVRVGNAAVQQKQLDVYGEVLDAAFLYHQRLKKPLPQKWWDEVCFLAGEAARTWREPDQGIWEFRGQPKQFLYSKLLCWVALDRAMKLGVHCDSRSQSPWKKTRKAIRKAILQEGYNERVGAFTQELGGEELDASALLIPVVGFLPATDPRVVSTMERISERLTSHGLVYRYQSADGLPGQEATFAICSFWLVDNLALAGRTGEARELFERIVAYAGDTGLFSEEIDPVNGDLLGNYPQGFTHLALIRSAFHIEKAEALGPEKAAHNPADRADRMEQMGHLPVATERSS
jgi:alpha,alpha-trehalase